ncbi:MAG: penicillin-binding transpeptidase domain-containing protein, partial [Sulfuriferula sp.]
HALYTQQATDAYSLADRGYISQIHPLELWLVRYLRSHSNATFSNIVAASREQRLEVYSWLFKTSRKNAQDRRIHSLLEVEAFQNIYLDWKRLGYPFDSLVPSYATAIGSSADRPAALAELMGVIVNNGVRLPAISIQKLHFAAGTPYDTVFVRQQPQGERLLPVELTQVVRRALQGVVEKGTAARLNGAFKDDDGNPIPMGGKTGTGDQRYKTFGAGGNLLTSRVVNRTATMVFFLGDRFFGTMTALVPGEKAAAYRFTSSLPAQILKEMGPALSSVLTPIKEQTHTKIHPGAAPESQTKPIRPVHSQPPHSMPQEKPESYPAEEESKPADQPKSYPDMGSPKPAATAPNEDAKPKSEETY